MTAASTELRGALEWLPAPLVLVTVQHDDVRNVQVAVRAMWLDEGDAPSLVIGGGPRNFTHQLIKQAREFAVNVPSTKLNHIIERARELARAGTHGDAVDKFAALQVQPRPATAIGAPLIADCVASFECRVRDIVDVNAEYSLITGDIVAVHRDPTLRPFARFNRTSFGLSEALE
jgi:flavin reductase (DIM6/NTAB) family NADH-FMN oxidoreductase RutF